MINCSSECDKEYYWVLHFGKNGLREGCYRCGWCRQVRPSL